ncbi:MAG: M48 family metalloprotease [bacterium]|nr:M48 family metalloprotease [bacterium]
MRLSTNNPMATYIRISRLKRLIPLVVVFISLLAPGCGETGPDGKFIWLPEFMEVGYGRMVDEGAQNEFAFVENPAIVEYVNEVGNSVAKHSQRPDLEYTFRILDDPVVNAFSYPGGFVYITSGALRALEDEAQLASLLGHEVAHIALYHGAEDAQWDILLLILSSYFDPDAVDAVEAGYGLATLGYSRENELSADYWGATYAAAAGYDPRGMVDFLGIVEGIEEGEGYWMPTFLSTHPDTENRIEELETVIFENNGNRNRDEYAKKIAYLDETNKPNNDSLPTTDVAESEMPINVETPVPDDEMDDDYGTFGEDWYIGY